jgi:hypothetical protein
LRANVLKKPKLLTISRFFISNFFKITQYKKILKILTRINKGIFHLNKRALDEKRNFGRKRKLNFFFEIEPDFSVNTILSNKNFFFKKEK